GSASSAWWRPSSTAASTRRARAQGRGLVGASVVRPPCASMRGSTARRWSRAEQSRSGAGHSRLRGRAGLLAEPAELAHALVLPSVFGGVVEVVAALVAALERAAGGVFNGVEMHALQRGRRGRAVLAVPVAALPAEVRGDDERRGNGVGHALSVSPPAVRATSP